MELITFNRGIDQISQIAQKKNCDFPEEKGSQSPVGQPTSYVKQLFSPQTTLQKMEDYVKPEITQRQLLIPSEFKKIRHKVLTDLSQSRALSDEESGRLSAAVELLHHETFNLELFEQYRHSLVKA